MKRRGAALVAGVALIALAVALPASGQDSPESLLPEGFGDPPAPPPTPPPPSPASPASSPRGPATPALGAAVPQPSLVPPGEGEEAEIDPELAALQAALRAQRADVPPAARRSLESVGFITPATGGLPGDVYGGRGGRYLLALLRSIEAPLISRWGQMMTRRLLASRTDSPANIAPQNWVAERAWLLLRMGEADAARALVQQVDSSRYTARLYDIGLQAYLANGDLAGTCPLVRGANDALDDRGWKMMQAICAGLEGEQSRASSLLSQARRRGWASGIDYRLAEKAVGAGFNSRRSVKIEWDGVAGYNAWRHGLSLAVGLNAPAPLWRGAGPQVLGWRATAPMLPATARLEAAERAAALGVLSGEAMTSLWSLAAAEGGGDDAAERALTSLRLAYRARAVSARIDAMRALWDERPEDGYARLVLTARAAARIAPSADIAAVDRDRLIAAMLSAGFDRAAVRWAQTVAPGDLGWALLAVGRPGQLSVDAGRLDAFFDGDGSENAKKSRLLLAALAGLGRVSEAAAASGAERLSLDLTRQTPWTRAIGDAARREQTGTVMLLAAAGLQGRDWQAMPAHHLYRLIAALRAVGLEAEARMIAAEAITRA